MPGLFGGSSSGGDYAIRAANIQAQAARDAANLEQQMYTTARADVAPWRQVGTAAVGQQAGLLSLPGYQAQDPTQVLQGTPGYSWLLGQGVNARDLSAASRGQLGSGAQQKGLTSFGQNLALTNAWNPYQQSLQNLSGQGLSAGNMSGNWGMQAGQVMGQDYMTGANAQAQGLYNKFMADQLAQQQSQQGWGSLLGFGMGLAGDVLGGPIGGMIGKGIGNLWGGGF